MTEHKQEGEPEADLATPSRHGDDPVTDEQTSTSQFEDLDTSAFDSSFAAVGGVQSTPHISSARPKDRVARQANVSPAPQRSSLPQHGSASLAHRNKSTNDEDPSTPRPRQEPRDELDSSPFGPLPSRNTAQKQATEPLLHRILDRNYRVQATPLARNPWDTLSAVRSSVRGAAFKAHSDKTPLGSVSTSREIRNKTQKHDDNDDSMFDSSPLNSPEMPTLSIRPDLLTRQRTPAGRRADVARLQQMQGMPRTPGISVLRPGYNNAGASGIKKVPDSILRSTALGPAAAEAAGDRTKAWEQRGSKTPALWDSDSDSDDEPSMQGPKTINFDLRDAGSINRFVAASNLSTNLHSRAAAATAATAAGSTQGTSISVPQPQTQPHRPILQTPAREASKRIEEDILSTARKPFTTTLAFPSAAHRQPGQPGRPAHPGPAAAGLPADDDDTFFDDSDDDDDDLVDFRGRMPLSLRSPGLAKQKVAATATEDRDAEPVAGLHGHGDDDDEITEVEYSPSIVRKAMLDDDDAF